MPGNIFGSSCHNARSPKKAKGSQSSTDGNPSKTEALDGNLFGTTPSSLPSAGTSWTLTVRAIGFQMPKRNQIGLPPSISRRYSSVSPLKLVYTIRTGRELTLEKRNAHAPLSKIGSKSSFKLSLRRTMLVSSKLQQRHQQLMLTLNTIKPNLYPTRLLTGKTSPEQMLGRIKVKAKARARERAKTKVTNHQDAKPLPSRRLEELAPYIGKQDHARSIKTRNARMITPMFVLHSKPNALPKQPPKVKVKPSLNLANNHPVDVHKIEIPGPALSLKGATPDRVGPPLGNLREADLNLVAARETMAKEKERIREKEKAKVTKAKAKRMPIMVIAHPTGLVPHLLAPMPLAVVPDETFAGPS